MKAASSFLTILFFLPLMQAQSLQIEFESLQKRREVALKEATAPIDKKFAESANAILAKAIQKGDFELAEKIKREIVNTQAPPREKIRNYLISFSWKVGDIIGNFQENGKFVTKKNTANYTIQDSGNILIDWGGGTTTLLVPNSDASQLQEQNGEKNLFKRVELKKGISSPPASPFGRPTP